MEVMTVRNINTGKDIRVLVDGPYVIGDLLIYKSSPNSIWEYRDNSISVATHNDMYHMWRKVVIIWK